VDRVYSTYEAKSRFSELMRQVRQGKRVLISYHGEPVAELRPLERAETEEEAMERMVREGTLSPPNPGPRVPFKPIANRPGALRRFLESRD
jgi:prevent-host-death family protein